MSDTGQYQYIFGNGTSRKTTNYGNTWVSDNQSSSATGVSGSGRYVIKRGDGYSISVSSNFGETYTGVGLSVTNLGGNAFTAIAISKTGQIMIVNGTTTLYKISNNFGRTWRDVTINATFTADIAMSASGKYILAGGCLSNNFGVSFETLPASVRTAYFTSTISANGQYMIVTRSDAVSVYSTDYGKTWTQRNGNGGSANGGGSGTSSSTMPSNASYVLQTTSNGLFNTIALPKWMLVLIPMLHFPEMSKLEQCAHNLLESTRRLRHYLPST
jgi:hypothetical protein